MRRRSNSIYANSLEEFTSILAFNGLIPPVRQKPKRLGNESSLKSSPGGEDIWEDFDYSKPRSSPEKIKKEGETGFFSIDLTENEQEPVSKHLVVKKIMVIGLRGSGKHFFVNSTFQTESNEKNLLPLKQTMDFILKTEAAEASETKYHFWIRELDEHKFDSLIKTYYKNISLFVFVYSINDRSSFEALDEAICSVIKEVPKERFMGIIIANRSDPNRNQEVSHAEGISLKEKYNLASFLDSNDVDIRQRLLEVLNL